MVVFGHKNKNNQKKKKHAGSRLNDLSKQIFSIYSELGSCGRQKIGTGFWRLFGEVLDNQSTKKQTIRLGEKTTSKYPRTCLKGRNAWWMGERDTLKEV